MDPIIDRPTAPRRTPLGRWILISLGILLLVFLSVIIVTAVSGCREISSLRTKNPTETAMMRYRQQQAGRKERKPVHLSSWSPLSSISPLLIQAVLIAEDDKFFQHDGFDWEGIKVAMEKDLDRKRFSAGGSTITQQLVKNLYLSPSKNPLRKLREAVLAVQMEKMCSKKRILELYLNVIEWGPGIYGIGSASRHYFHKPPADLQAGEAIRLASVLPNPSRYSPVRDTNRRMRRQRLRLAEILFKRGLVDEAAYQQLTVEFSAMTTDHP
ncbi:MAG TPA: monofunctional biosynthetic peptidoglycan transglycosylase [bacterium]|nr:monofunctional biosynthetic peptidoglycan transglycosylase [bacterium]